MTMTSTKAFEAVRSAAETIRNDEPAIVEGIGLGDVVRQGDIYLVAIDKPLKGKKLASRQLAPGTTQGSRHVAVGKCKITEVDEDAATATVNRLVPTTRNHRLFVGPQIEAVEAVTIEHPEHGNRTLPPGTYLTLYQRTWAQEVRRQVD